MDEGDDPGATEERSAARMASVLPLAIDVRPRPSAPRVALGPVVVWSALAVVAASWLVRVDTHWVSPRRLARSDPRVVELAAALDSATSRRAALGRKEEELRSRLAPVRARIELEAPVASTLGALRSNLDEARAALEPLAAALAVRGEEAVDASRAELLARVRRLAQALRGHGLRSPSQALAVVNERDRTNDELDRQREREEALDAELRQTRGELEAADRTLTRLHASPYSAALEGDVVLGFVHPDDLASSRPGADVLACRLGVVLCRKVGTVDATVSAEHGASPFPGEATEGRLVVLSLDEPSAGDATRLVAGRPPLGF